MVPEYGERFTLVQMRTLTAFSLRGTRGSAQYKTRLFACPSLAELETLLCEIFEK